MFTDFRDWLKTHQKEIILFILILLISSTSFGLGYLFGQKTNQTPIIIETNN